MSLYLQTASKIVSDVGPRCKYGMRADSSKARGVFVGGSDLDYQAQRRISSNLAIRHYAEDTLLLR
jgi:hypothetical protein